MHSFLSPLLRSFFNVSIVSITLSHAFLDTSFKGSAMGVFLAIRELAWSTTSVSS